MGIPCRCRIVVYDRMWNVSGGKCFGKFRKCAASYRFLNRRKQVGHIGAPSIDAVEAQIRREGG